MEEGGKSFEGALRNAWLRLTRVWLEMFAAPSPRPRGLESPVSELAPDDVNYKMKRYNVIRWGRR